MLDKLLLWARNMEASDLHIRPASVPMVRVDGSLQPLQNEFISREKLEAKVQGRFRSICDWFVPFCAPIFCPLREAFVV